MKGSEKQKTRALPAPGQRRRASAAFLVLLVFLIAAAASVPLVYPSMTLWYKTGMDRVLLQAGKMSGLAALVLMALQVILVARLPPVERTFGLDRLVRLHRVNGGLLVLLAVAHVALVLVPEGLANLPLGKKYWPEMVGILLFFLLQAIVLSALLRRRLGLAYHRWRGLHRVAGYLVLLLAGIHVFFVSDSFAQGVPRGALLAGLATVFIIVASGKAWRAWRVGHRLAVVAVEPLPHGVTRVEMRPVDRKPVGHAPGQFAFFSVDSPALPPEAHPFTIASSPEAADSIELFIKDCGDWTAKVAGVVKGIPVRVEGPYGLFSMDAEAETAGLVLLAGGIGITPMLSMLRSLAARRSARRVVLIWSVRADPGEYFTRELERLRRALPGLTVHVRVTGDRSGGRISQAVLAGALGDVDRGAPVFLCGPEAMMDACRGLFRQLGFRAIRWERFGL